MYRLIMGYLERLPKAAHAEGGAATGNTHGPYSPHSLRATSATLLLGAGVDIRKVQELPGHRHVTTTQIDDKRRIAATQGASHDRRSEKAQQIAAHESPKTTVAISTANTCFPLA